MTSTNGRIGGIRSEVDYQKLGPALLIAASLVRAIRTARWPATHSDGLAEVDWQKEVEYTARVAKAMLTHVTHRFPVSSHREMCLSTRLQTMTYPAEAGGGKRTGIDRIVCTTPRKLP